MADAIYTVILDVTDNGCIDTGWRLHQGDYGESQVVVKVVNNGVNMFDASILPQITFKRSDGISIVGEMFIEDSTYKYNFVGNELEVPGFVLMDVKLIDSQGRTSTAASRFIVLPNTEGDTQEGSHTYINSGLVSELRENVQTAVESAATSTEKALVSEGWAVGEQNGVPVPPTSPYYHNNAKYFASQAQTSEGLLASGDVTLYPDSYSIDMMYIPSIQVPSNPTLVVATDTNYEVVRNVSWNASQSKLTVDFGYSPTGASMTVNYKVYYKKS